MLVSVYHLHMRGMRTSGPKDATCRLFRVNRSLPILLYMVAHFPHAFRFVAEDDGTIIFLIRP